MVLTDDGRQADPSVTEAGQHHPVIFEHPLLLRLWRTISPAPQRIRDGVPGERWQRDLGVIPEIEIPLVSAAVRASQ
jgi:hypothetical protein